MIYPALVYRCPGNCQRPKGTYEAMRVADEIEAEARIKDGWFLSLLEAIDAHENPKQAQESAATTRDELEQMARELGIKFDGRTTDRKLRELIEAK